MDDAQIALDEHLGRLLPAAEERVMTVTPIHARSAVKPIPVNTPLLNGRERELLIECIETGWISSEGPFVSRFEEEFSRRMGRKFGVAVANGSAALDVAVQALRLGPGAEVIMPSFTIISPAASVVRAGATPMLVDSDPTTWNVQVSQIDSCITPRTRAILVVHIYGLPVDMDPVLKIAERHGLAVIEDAAEMHGQTYRGRPCGSFGDISVFSFYPNKHVTTGEGGMVVTDDPALAERCKSLRNLCFQPARRFVHEELGWNYRMTNLQAALGLAQLERLDEFVGRKRAMGRRYNELLADLPGVQQPLAATDYADNIYWVYGLVLTDKVPIDAAEAMRRLANVGIGTRPFFWPIHEQPVFRRMGLFEDACLPVSSRLARRGFYLPSGLALSPDDIDLVAALVMQTLGTVSRQ
jgi:perosamine synthetase